MNIISLKRDWSELLSPLVLSIISAVLTLILSILMLKNGIGISPDGWAYWQGSVSLLELGQYSYINGEPIVIFSPTFSIYLAGIQAIFGISGFSLGVAIVLLAILTSFLWTLLFTSLCNSKANGMTLQLLIMIYVSAFIVSNYTALYAETLFLPFLGLFLFLLFRLFQTLQAISFKNIMTIIIVLSIVFLSKNSSLALVPGIALVIFLQYYKKGWRKSILYTFLLVGIPLMIWFVQVKSITGKDLPMVFFNGRYSPFEFFGQMIQSIYQQIGPISFNIGLYFTIALIVMFIITLSRNLKKVKSVQQVNILQLLVISLTGAIGIFILVNLVWIAETLSGRYLWVVVLIIVGALLAWITWLPKTTIRKILLYLLIITVLFRVGRTVNGIAQRWDDLWYPNIKLNHTISPDYIAGPPIEKDEKTIIIPPGL